MDEAQVGQLETAIADLGALLVRVQKYRRGAGPEGAALMQAAMSLGDAARRLHRHDHLDLEAVGRLLAETERLRDRLLALLAEVRASGDHRAAVEAHAAGDRATLARALPALFAGLEPVARPPDLFRAIPWRRRGRIRPAADLASEICRLRDEGFAAEGDDLSPGADADLPAVVLQDTFPLDEPVAARLPAATVGSPILQLTDTGDYLVHTPALRAPFVVRLAPEPPTDEVDTTAVDYARYCAELTTALEANGIPVDA